MNLKRLREDRDMSVRALAAKAGMSYAYLSNVENGKADPSLSVLRKLAATLRVTVGELIGERPAKPRRKRYGC